MNAILHFGLFFLCSIMFAQEVRAQKIEVSGFVKDKVSDQGIGGVEVAIKNSDIKTYTDPNGAFYFALTSKPSSAIVATFNGYAGVERMITDSDKSISIYLEPVSVLETPLSNKKLNQEHVIANALPSFYDALSNMPGIGINTPSFLYKSFSARGINSMANLRFSQYIDGMDTQFPGFNFPVGNILGVADIDLENAELLSEVSPALHGSGGVNGALLVHSKNPFTYPGLSAQFRLGLNHLDNYQSSRSSWEDMSLRYARVLNRKLAVKVALAYIQGEDWESRNLGNFDRLTMQLATGNRYSNAAYDGVNVYGDENGFRTPTLEQIGYDIKEENEGVPCHCLPEPQRSIVTAYNNGMLPKLAVTRTGYIEEELVDYGNNSLKTIGSIHYKISNTIEAVAQVNWRKANTMYTDVDRYALKDFSLSQYKLELKGKQFMLRGYTTRVNSGKTYNVTRLGGLINEDWKPTSTWMQEYIAAFSAEKLKNISDQDAHNTARAIADYGRPEPGSDQYTILKNKLMKNDAMLQDRSNLLHYEGAYNFTSLFNNKVDLLAGGFYRTYNLNSGGILFDDLNRNISMAEYGGYLQLGKSITSKLKLAGSVRIDKSNNFNALYSPGLVANYTISPNNSFRASYQFRQGMPTIQDQYLDSEAANGGIRLIGGLPEMLNQYNLYTNRPYTAESYRDYVLNGALLQEYGFNESGLSPEQVQAVELGYRGLFSNKFLIDAYSYFRGYQHYISAIDVYQTQIPGDISPENIVRYHVPVNMEGNPYSWGLGMGMGYNYKKLTFNGNVSYHKNDKVPIGFNEGFNMPQVLFNFGVSSRDIVKNVGFNLVYRWQEDFYWQSSFVSGQVPAFGTLDGQFSLKIPSYNSIIKIGGSNLLNQYYKTSYGNPLIGGMYYVSVLFNEFLK